MRVEVLRRVNKNCSKGNMWSHPCAVAGSPAHSLHCHHLFNAKVGIFQHNYVVIIIIRISCFTTFYFLSLYNKLQLIAARLLRGVVMECTDLSVRGTCSDHLGGVVGSIL